MLEIGTRFQNVFPFLVTKIRCSVPKEQSDAVVAHGEFVHEQQNDIIGVKNGS